jgi:hypothetical protein
MILIGAFRGNEVTQRATGTPAAEKKNENHRENYF